MITHNGDQDSRQLVVRPRLGDRPDADLRRRPIRSASTRCSSRWASWCTAGSYETDEREGVLLDVTVGQVRCVLVHQEPALRVTLSPRERQIALMVAHGRTNQAIATSLEISVWTVSTHLRRIFAKLAVSSRAEMVARLLADHDYSPLVIPD